MVYFTPFEATRKCWRRHKIVLIGAILVLIGASLLTAGLILYFKTKTTRLGAIVSNGYECASIGSEIFDKGGSAIDATIATLFCEGVAMPQSMGLGGGFLMTIYIKETGTVETLNAREVAPLSAHRDMYANNASLSSKGGLSIAVPGELKGYWEAHQKYGKLEWADVVQPTIDLCKKGILVTPFLAGFFTARKTQLLASETLREVFINPNTNDTYKEGEYLKRVKLAETLEVIAKEGADAIYNGSLTGSLVEDIQENGGIITAEDFYNYRAEWSEPIVIKLPSNQTLYSVPPPGSGAVLGFILNILKNYLDLNDATNSIINWQRVVESFKHAYGRRTQLGDPRFSDITELIANLTSDSYAFGVRTEIFDNKTFQDPEYYGAVSTTIEDHGTAHVSVLAPNGDAVSVTSTINFYFGSDIRSKSTGIILNDEMDDFSSPNTTNDYGLPPSPANFIEPGKCPVSSMSPTLVTDKDGNVILIVGAAGGSKITTSVALVIIRHLWFGEDLAKALDESRFHHQLFPMAIQFESDYDEDVIRGLAAIGHNYTVSSNDGFAALTAISKDDNDDLEAVYDRRRGGNTAIVNG